MGEGGGNGGGGGRERRAAVVKRLSLSVGLGSIPANSRKLFFVAFDITVVGGNRYLETNPLPNDLGQIKEEEEEVVVVVV